MRRRTPAGASFAKNGCIGTSAGKGRLHEVTIDTFRAGKVPFQLLHLWVIRFLISKKGFCQEHGPE